MQSETPGNIAWKDKLAELESFEGDAFNKEASWNKLHVRLQPKRKKKKIIWYWAAAMCLLFILSISFLLLKKKENILLKNNLSQKDIKSSSSQKPIIREAMSAIISSSNKSKKPILSFIKDDKLNAIINRKTNKPESIANKNVQEEEEKVKLNDKAVMPIDTTISIAVNIPEKKKLKVVHLNEISEPAVIEIANTARIYDRHNFQFKIMNQQGIASSSFSSNNKPLKIFTSRNVPVK